MCNISFLFEELYAVLSIAFSWTSRFLHFPFTSIHVNSDVRSMPTKGAAPDHDQKEIQFIELDKAWNDQLKHCKEELAYSAIKFFHG